MHHILVVEDEEHLAFGIKFNLQAEGFQTTAVADGPSALELIQQPDSGIDLVILDIMLPGMSGYEVCERLRELGYQMPILILSARTLSEDRARGFDVGADQYLNKPFELDELLSRVKNLLTRFSKRPPTSYSDQAEDRASSETPDEVTIASSTVNFETFEVSKEGTTHRLTALEMKLLRYFFENQGRVIPRFELLENVWGTSGDITTRAPDQFIRRLRKIFEPSPSRPRHFLTVRDAGYRFVLQTDPDGTALT